VGCQNGASLASAINDRQDKTNIIIFFIKALTSAHDADKPHNDQAREMKFALFTYPP
jgi:hypothetical protein